MTNIILSCFKDDSIHAWESETLDYKYQIPPPFGPTPRYRTFTVPRDGHLLVGGGRSNFLHVWTIENRQLLRVIQLPSKVRFVKQLIFLPNKFDGGSSEVRVMACIERKREIMFIFCIEFRISCSGWNNAVH